MNFEQPVGTDRRKILRVDRDQVLLARGDTALLSAKRVTTTSANVCRKRLRDFGGKRVHDLLTFSVESSGECTSQVEWHVSLKIADTSVKFKIDSGAYCNVISKSLFD